MRKLFVTIIALSCYSSALQAQNIYVRGSVGLAMPAAGQNMNTNGIPFNGKITYSGTQASSSLTAFQSSRVSFNTGIQAQVGIGYLFTEHIGIDLGLTIGAAHNIYKSTAQFPSDPYYVTQSFSYYAKTPIIMMPAMVLQSGGKMLNFYSRFGIAIPLKTKLTTELNQTLAVMPLNQTNSTLSAEEELSFSPGFGFTGAAGVKYKLGDHMQLLVEVSGIALSVYAEEAELVRLSSNGNAIAVSQLSDDVRITRYSSDMAAGSEPTFSMPFSNIGFNAGVSLNL